MAQVRSIQGREVRSFEVNYDEWLSLVDELGELAKMYEARGRDARQYGNDEDAADVEKAVRYRRMRESLMRPVFHSS